MGTKVNRACAMRPQETPTGDRFEVFPRRDPDRVVALVVKQKWRNVGRKVEGPWAVLSANGAPMLDGGQFMCRQAAYRAFMAHGGAELAALNRAEARHAA